MEDYDRLSPVQLELLKNGVIDLNGKVDNNMAIYAREATQRLLIEGSPDIEIRITSCGGDIIPGLHIYDLLRFYKGKKTGIAMCFTRSIGAIILQACDIRKCLEHSYLLIHDIGVDLYGVCLDNLQDESKRKSIVSVAHSNQVEIYRILSQRTGRSVKAIARECRNNRDMTAKKALKFGLIDKIIRKTVK